MTGSPRVRAAVLGDPVTHSLSPALHRAAYAALGLERWSYDAVTCDEAGLEPFLGQARRDGGWAGFSLTMPLKIAGVGYCDEVRTNLGAINTIVVDGDRLIGHNTDVDGIEAALDALCGRAVPLDQVALLGAGGTARAVVAALARRGVTALTIHVRDAGRAAQVAALAREAGIEVEVAGFDAIASGATIISTLPAAAGAQLVSSGVMLDGPLLDVVYAPWPTALAAAVRANGRPVVSGLEVLLAQAAVQVTLMTGFEAPIAAMRTAGERALVTRPAD